MADLPFATHRYMIEPVTNTRHMKIKLLRDYLSFIERIKKSKKPVLKQLYDLAKSDVRTTTGSNLRNILLLTDLNDVDDLHPGLVNSLQYHMVEEKEQWRVNMVKELINIKQGVTVLPDVWSTEELESILTLLCTE